jgi:signal transduction histidine kinase
MIAGVLVTGRDITERARDAELHRMHAVRLGILQEIDRAILASQPPAALIASALDGLRQLTQSALAVALLWDSEAGVARVIAGRSEDARQWFPLTTLQLIEFSPAATFLEQPTIYVEDLSELVSASPIIERARRAGMRSLLTEALCSDGQLFGLLTFCAETVAAFEPDYRSVVREVANQLAIALLQERMRGQLQLHTLQLEERVRERTAELEAVNQDLETFSVSVSHDLRAPLRMLEGYSRLLKEALSESPGAEVSEYLSRIRASVRRMEELIEALLRLSRVARSEPRWESVYLSHLAEAAVADLRRRHPARKVEFLCAPFMVARGDREMLTIALENLLANAWKYTGRHPTALVEFGAQERDGMLVYFVRDDGAGFDIKSADNLFTPFRRLHRDDEFEGTGIGLATVQRIVRRHGGTIWAEAAVERGATFYFTLRLAS